MTIYEGLRSIFFGDQDIYEEDLNNIEYTKLRTFRRSLAACIKQPGVAITSLSSTDLKVNGSTVNPGVAIDRYGRLIYVPSNTSASGSVATDPYYHPAWPSRTASGSGNYINIYYDVQYDISESNDSGTSHYTRVYDSYEILAEDSPPSDESGGICLASGGADCRPLLLPRGATEATSTLDEVWLGTRTDGGYLWTGNSSAHTVAEIAYRYKGGAYLNILYSMTATPLPGFSFDGSFIVSLINSLTGAVISTKTGEGAGSGYYAISFPISSLSAAALYSIKISFGVILGSGTITINNVSIYVTS